MDDVDFVNSMLGVCHCASQSPIGAVATPGLNEIYSISRPMKKTARNSCGRSKSTGGQSLTRANSRLFQPQLSLIVGLGVILSAKCVSLYESYILYITNKQIYIYLYIYT